MGIFPWASTSLTGDPLFETRLRGEFSAAAKPAGLPTGAALALLTDLSALNEKTLPVNPKNRKFLQIFSLSPSKGRAETNIGRFMGDDELFFIPRPPGMRAPGQKVAGWGAAQGR
jgi:hypothetical protein